MRDRRSKIGARDIAIMTPVRVILEPVPTRWQRLRSLALWIVAILYLLAIHLFAYGDILNRVSVWKERKTMEYKINHKGLAPEALRRGPERLLQNINKARKGNYIHD